MVSAMVVSAVTDQCDARSLLWFSPCCLPFPPACLWCAVFPRVAWQPAGMPFGVQVDGVGTELNCTASSWCQRIAWRCEEKDARRNWCQNQSGDWHSLFPDTFQLNSQLETF